MLADGARLGRGAFHHAGSAERLAGWPTRVRPLRYGPTSSCILTVGFILEVRDMANVVGERYQITIDKRVRDELGVRPGDIAIERAEAGRLVVDFVGGSRDRSLLGIFRRPDMEPITDWQAVKDRAWAARSAEIMEVLREDSARHRAEGAVRDGDR